MNEDYWVETNLPKEEKFDRAFVKYLMKLAYKEGKNCQRNYQLEEEREAKYGPRFI